MNPQRHVPATTAVVVALTVVVVFSMIDALARADLESAHTVCAGFFGCGAPPEGWWVTAAGLLLFPLAGLALHAWRTDQ